jgi:predicted nuclease of predicted toxin-antitoxin system
VTTSAEAGLRTRSGEDQITYVRQQHRVIITHDADFVRFASSNHDHPGIAYCDRTGRTIGEMIRSLILMYEILTPDEVAGRVEYL